MSMYNIMTLWVLFKSENCMSVAAPQKNPVGTDYFMYPCIKFCSLVVCFLLPKAPIYKGPQYVSIPPPIKPLPLPPYWLTTHSGYPLPTPTLAVHTHFVPHVYSWTAWPWYRRQYIPSKCCSLTASPHSFFKLLVTKCSAILHLLIEQLTDLLNKPWINKWNK